MPFVCYGFRFYVISEKYKIHQIIMIDVEKGGKTNGDNGIYNLRSNKASDKLTRG